MKKTFKTKQNARSHAITFEGTDIFALSSVPLTCNSHRYDAGDMHGAATGAGLRRVRGGVRGFAGRVRPRVDARGRGRAFAHTHKTHSLNLRLDRGKTRATGSIGGTGGERAFKKKPDGNEGSRVVCMSE